MWSITHGEQPFPVISQVSLDGTTPNVPSVRKDPSLYTAEEKRIRKIDRLERSLLIRGIPNNIYSLIDMDKKEDGKKRDMSKVKCYNCKKEGHFSKDRRKAIVKDYNYFKIKMLHANKDSDDQVLLAKDLAWMEMSSDSEEELSANMAFTDKMENIISNSEENSSFDKDTIVEVSYYSSDSESESKFDETSDYSDKFELNYGLFVDKDDDQAFSMMQLNLSQNDHDESEIDHSESEDKDYFS
ncbi:integrase, catalytic region, zinc finger, CCHC-type containing protein [Tanacetum coccineum]